MTGEVGGWATGWPEHMGNTRRGDMYDAILAMSPELGHVDFMQFGAAGIDLVDAVELGRSQRDFVPVQSDGQVLPMYPDMGPLSLAITPDGHAVPSQNACAFVKAWAATWRPSVPPAALPLSKWMPP